MPCNRRQNVAPQGSGHYRTKRLAVLAGCFILIHTSQSCADTSGPRVGSIPARISVVSQVPATGYRTGAVVYPPVVVRVTDEAGLPVPSTELVFTGDGQVEPNPTVTGEDGTAAVSWRLGLQVGLNSLSVSAPSAPSVSAVTIATTTTRIPGLVTELWVLPTGATIDQGASFTIRAAGWRESEITEDIALSWASSNPSVASVSSTGLVSALSPGITTITAMHEDRRRVGFAVRLSARTVVAVPVPAGPGGPGIPAFTMAITTRTFNPWVTILRSDGTVEATIVCGVQCGGVGSPNWSRDGSKLAMTGERDTLAVLFVANRDGTDLHEVASAPRFLVRTDRFTFSYYPEFFEDWSADGTLVYVRTTKTGQSIETVAADGTARSTVMTTSQTLTTPFEGIVGEPRWGPQDTVITATISGQLHAMQPDGTNLRALSASDAPRSFSHSWSPDGRSIAWTFGGAGDSEGIATLDPISGSLRQVTLPAGSVGSLCWSPLTSGLAFVHTSGSLEEAWSSIYTMNADGSGLKKAVVPMPGRFVGWTPDERFLVYTDFRFYSGGKPSQLYAQSVTMGTNTRLSDVDHVERATIAGTRGCGIR